MFLGITMRKKPLIGIIGGTGKMGNWFRIFFEKQGLEVIISDTETKLSNTQLAKRADIIIVSVPIDVAKDVIQEVKDFIRKDALLTDITSLKVETTEAMKGTRGGALGMHPLFGPLVPDLKGQTIVFCKVKGSKWIAFLKNLFKKNGAKIEEISAKEHDMRMAYVQSLLHFTNLAFSHFLFRKKFSPPSSFLTPVFKLQSLVFGRILGQNPKLCADIEMQNPCFRDVLKEYSKEIERFKKVVVQKDNRKFQKKFKESASYLSNFVDVAEEKTSEILKLLEKQPIKISPPKKIEIKKAKIGFLGPKGTFSWIAAQNIAPTGCSLKPFSTIREVFEGVNNFEVDFGVVPIQNLVTGIIPETMHAFIDYPLYSLGSFKIPIQYCLLSKEKKIKDIKVLKSHPQAFLQCRAWISKNLPQALKIPTQSTVFSVSNKNQGEGYIVPLEAASLFDINVLAKNIEDNKENSTRFFVVAREMDKDLLKKIKIHSNNTLLLLSVYDRPGVLRDILNIFANSGINLAALHSIPAPFHPWDYLFFLEIEKPYFSLQKEILNELNKYCPYIRVLGIS